jgi:hypothetical protein
MTRKSVMTINSTPIYKAGKPLAAGDLVAGQTVTIAPDGNGYSVVPDAADIAGQVATLLLPHGEVARSQTTSGSEIVKFTPALASGYRRAFNITITKARN